MSHSFHPKTRTLMGPGPSDVPAQILEALSRPTIGHLDGQFIELMNDIKRLLQYAFQTKNELTLPISAPGSAGMECCFVNLIEAGDTVIVCQNGVFGTRMIENVQRCGATAIVVEDTWGTAVSAEKVTAALIAHPEAKIVAFVHAETSTGVRSDVKSLCTIAAEHGCLSIVDAVTSLGGIDVNVDDWGADAVYSGTQKCLSCVPGLSPVTFSPKAVTAIKVRTTKVQSWFLDMQLIMGYWGDGSNSKAKRAYHHTAPVNAMYALHESLLMLEQEGLSNAWQRHRINHLALVAGIEAMGLTMTVDANTRLPQLNSVDIPQGIDDASVRQALLDNYQLEIGAGLGVLAGKVWRIGLMGYTSNRKNVLLCLDALENTLSSMEANINIGVAVDAALTCYQND